MIKLVYVIVRKPGLSVEAFRGRWLNRHGPLVAAQAQTLKLRKYIQSHPIDDPTSEAMHTVRGMREAADGVTEVWWDSLEDFQAAYATPEGAEAGRILAEDESGFIDFERSAVFLTEEHLIFDRTGGRGPGATAVKAICLLMRRDGLTPAQCHQTWLSDRGPRVARYAEQLRMARYVQSHAIAPDVNAAMRAGRGYEPPLDGVAEVWFGSAEGLQGVGAAARHAEAALIADERRFVRMDRSRFFLTREHVIFDHTRQEVSSPSH